MLLYFVLEQTINGGRQPTPIFTHRVQRQGFIIHTLISLQTQTSGVPHYLSFILLSIMQTNAGLIDAMRTDVQALQTAKLKVFDTRDRIKSHDKWEPELEF